ncbi:MAG TPA: hypothetical protein VNT51_00165, partial [Miltoncostaeaceae bacterium]|nr:hypothetical protein [Miltoncostaeaceae bacterium]
REVVAMVGDALGRPVRLRATRRLAMRLAGLAVPEARELPDIWYQFTTPWEVDASAFAAAFPSPPPTPLTQAVAETAAWWRSRAASR